MSINLFPAVVIGGPPHAGKSVLAYSLSQALRQRRVEHYVLRAYPDGEGDWSNEAPPTLVRLLRVKGMGTPAWIANVCRDIAQRQLPLIVDVGGKPTTWQEAVFEQCTQGILLTTDAASHRDWQDLLTKHGVMISADLHSDLHGTNHLEPGPGTVLRGTIAGLERGCMAAGVVFEALVERLYHLFYQDAETLRAHHLRTAPVETVVDLPRVGRTLGLLAEDERWEPADVPAVLDYLPAQTPLALYGRVPNWLFAAVALHAYPAPYYQFDPRLGWVAPQTIKRATEYDCQLLKPCLIPYSDYAVLDVILPHKYLDYSEITEVCVPPRPATPGLVLSGQLAMWQYSSLALTYRDVSWLAVYQPPLGSNAVVVKSNHADYAIGDLVPLNPKQFPPKSAPPTSATNSPTSE